MNVPIVLEAMDFPAPVIAVAIEPKTKADQEKLGNALAKLTQEDPTLKYIPIPTPAKRLLLGWESCTWKFWWTA